MNEKLFRKLASAAFVAFALCFLVAGFYLAFYHSRLYPGIASGLAAIGCAGVCIWLLNAAWMVLDEDHDFNR